jgi:hypothetical protein
MISLGPFRNVFSSSAFVNIKTADGIEHHLIGKFIDVEVLGGDSNQTYDLWLVRRDREPISTRKLNNLISTIQALPEYEQAGRPKIIRLDGEAYLRTTHAPLVREVGSTAGIRRKKRYSEATRQARRAQLAKLNSSRCVA